MTIDVRGIHLELTDPLVEYVQSHVTKALDAYERRVQSVEVRLCDTHGKKHGPDMQCQVQVALRGLKPIIVQHTHEDLYAAIDAAAGRTKHTIRRTIGRQRDTKRGGAWAPDKRLVA